MLFFPRNFSIRLQDEESKKICRGSYSVWLLDPLTHWWHKTRQDILGDLHSSCFTTFPRSFVATHPQILAVIVWRTSLTVEVTFALRGRAENSHNQTHRWTARGQESAQCCTSFLFYFKQSISLVWCDNRTEKSTLMSSHLSLNPEQEQGDWPAPLMAARSSNDSSICDSTWDQHPSKKKKSSWKFPLVYCVWIQWVWDCFLNTSCWRSAAGWRLGGRRMKLTLVHKAMSYLIPELALVRRFSLKMVDWLVSSRHVRVIQIPASYFVCKGGESKRNENQMKRWKTITEVCVSGKHKQLVYLHAFCCFLSTCKRLHMSRNSALSTKGQDPCDLTILLISPVL